MINVMQKLECRIPQMYHAPVDGLAKRDRITHRIVITSRGEIDSEVKHWIRFAFDLDS